VAIWIVWKTLTRPVPKPSPVTSTPDQSNVEENAFAVGVSFEDNEELELKKRLRSAIAIVLSGRKLQNRRRYDLIYRQFSDGRPTELS